MTDFQGVIDAWDADGRTGGNHIHPHGPDTPEFWALGEQQAQQVSDYARLGATVFDFGAGIGRLSIPLVKMGFKVTAVDSSQAMLDGLAERAATAGVDVPAIRSDGSDLAKLMRGRRAHVVIARAVLIHHDYAGVDRIVTALARVMRPGGYLIADWPIGDTHERMDWIDVTTWETERRTEVAARAGLEPVIATEPSVWRKRKAAS